MSWFDRVLGRESRTLTAAGALWSYLQGYQTSTNVLVNEKTALTVTTVFTAVRILSETFAQVPLKVYRKNPDGSRSEAPDKVEYRMLHDQPNREMTSYTLREVSMGHLTTWGNSYWEIERNIFGDAIALWPLLPDSVRPYRRNGELWYEVRVSKDPATSSTAITTQGAAAQTIHLPARDVLHVPGLGYDGLRGYSVIRMIREGIGLEAAYQEFSGRFFSNGAQPGFVLTTDKTISKEQTDELERRWKEGHQGLTNANRLAILTGGLRPEKIGIAPEDAQFIESRKYQRGEILGFYRIPPHMAGDTEKSTSWGTGIEQMSVGFVTYTMMPYFSRFEQAINMKLFGPASKFFCAFDPDGLLRGDFKARMDGYQLGRQGGWYSVNDIRRKEDMAPIGPEGDIYLSPMNMQKAEFALEKPEPPTPAALPAGDEQKPDKPDERAAVLAHRHALADVTERILRREQTDVSRGIERLLKRGQHADIPLWVEAFYAEHRVWAAKMATPTFAGLAETVRALRGVKADPEYVRTVQACVEGYVKRLGSESQDDLRRAIRGEPDDFGRILASWERRPEQIAEREVLAAAAVLGRSLGDDPQVRADPMLALADAIASQPAQVVNNYIQPAAPAEVRIDQPITVQPADVRLEQPITVQPAAPAVLNQPITVQPAAPAEVRLGETHIDARTTVEPGAVHVEAQDPEVDTTLEYDASSRVKKMSKRRKGK